MAVSIGGERGKALQGIVQSLHHSSELEAWGLMVEAAEEYQKTTRRLKHAASTDNSSFVPDEKELFARLAVVLQSKSSSLQDLSSVQEPNSTSSVDMKKIKTALEGLMEGSVSAATIESTLIDILPSAVNSGLGSDKLSGSECGRPTVQVEDEYSKAAAGKAGSLLTRRDILPGYSYLTITIEKIGLKDPENYIDPFITVSVKSLMAENIEASQETPVVSEREISYIVFKVPVQIQNPLEEIPGGSAIFFEFKHYKPKKGTRSTKCFSFMEMDEIRPGKAFLEIYKKPTDFRRKKLSLLSVKPLYLHLNLTLDKT